MVDVLMLCREHPVARVELAVCGALTAGAHDGKAVALLARQAQRPAVAALEVDAKLQGIGASAPTDLADYDTLRDHEAGA
jgi:Flp pilus assembly protein TadB